jgi:hypothetical protein
LGVRATSDSDYRRTAEARKVSDPLGNGLQLVAFCNDVRRQLDFEIRLTLYDGRNALVVETIVSNTSPKDQLILLLEPVRAVYNEGGRCDFSDVKKVLTNGYMYANPGRLQDFLWIDRVSSQSMWNTAFYRDESHEALVIGFLENDMADGRISAWYDNTAYSHNSGAGFGFALIAESSYNRECVLRTGSSVTSGRLLFQLAEDPFTALESYADALGAVHKVRLNPIVNGWCNWYYTHEYVTEDEIIRNAEFAARHLKSYGLQYVQIDGGYQRAYGDWEGNKRFPHGMKWLAARIRDLGLKPGLWLAPYCIGEGTEVHEQHPDWLIHDLWGNVQLCGGGSPVAHVGLGYGEPSMMKKIYGLDISHPAASNWMRRLFEMVARDWGYEFIKIDFVEWTLLAAERYHDPTFSKAAAYRKGLETIRLAIGPDRHLLDCGPMNNTVGILDSTRIELDLPYLTWEQYTGNFNSNAPAMAKRYYFHKRTWINDDDHLGLALLTIPQAQAAATIIALSGGTLISGDRLIDLDPFRLEILKKVYPAYGEAARPIDLFERDKPEIFALPVKTSFGEWTLAAIFNYDANATADKRVTLARLRLNPAREYIGYDFWKQEWIGDLRHELHVTLEPGSVALVALHEKQAVPQVVSTDRHYAQGALELETVVWDNTSLSLRGVSLGPPSTEHNVAIYIPEQYAWEHQLTDYFYDFDDYSLKLMAPKILRAHLRFGGSGRVPWQVRFSRVR